MPEDRTCWKCSHHAICFILRDAKEFFNSGFTSYRISNSIDMLSHPDKFDLSDFIRLICGDCRLYEEKQAK